MKRKFNFFEIEENIKIMKLECNEYAINKEIKKMEVSLNNIKKIIRENESDYDIFKNNDILRIIISFLIEDTLKNENFEKFLIYSSLNKRFNNICIEHIKKINTLSIKDKQYKDLKTFGKFTNVIKLVSIGIKTFEIFRESGYKFPNLKYINIKIPAKKNIENKFKYLFNELEMSDVKVVTTKHISNAVSKFDFIKSFVCIDINKRKHHIKISETKWGEEVIYVNSSCNFHKNWYMICSTDKDEIFQEFREFSTISVIYGVINELSPNMIYHEKFEFKGAFFWDQNKKTDLYVYATFKEDWEIDKLLIVNKKK